MMATRLSIMWGRSPFQIYETTSTRDFAFYHAFYELEPFGFRSQAFLASVIANMSGKSVKKPLSETKFLER